MFNNKLTPWKHWGTDRNDYSTYLYRTKVLCKLNITGSRRPLPNETTWVNIKLRWHDTLNREYSIPLTTAWSVKPSWSKRCTSLLQAFNPNELCSLLIEQASAVPLASRLPDLALGRLCLASPRALRLCLTPTPAFRWLSQCPCPRPCPSPRFLLMCLPYFSCSKVCGDYLGNSYTVKVLVIYSWKTVVTAMNSMTMNFPDGLDLGLWTRLTQKANEKLFITLALFWLAREATLPPKSFASSPDRKKQ